MKFFKFVLRAPWMVITYVLVGALWSVCVQAEASLTHEVERLKRQLLTLEQSFYRGANNRPPAPLTPTPSGIPSASSPGAMEQEIQRLTAALEETRHTVKVQQNEIRALKNDIELRLSQLEKKKTLQEHTKDPVKSSPELQTPPSKMPAPKERSLEKNLTLPEKKTPVHEPSPSQTLSPEPLPVEALSSAQSLPADDVVQEYNESLSLLKNKDYGAAQKAFSSFITNHPNHDLTGNAQFWLGEALAASGDYTQASVAFLTAYKNYPQNSKRPESLLKLAHCLGQLGKQKEACATLQKLSVDFSQGSSALKRMAAEEQRKNGCL